MLHACMSLSAINVQKYPKYLVSKLGLIPQQNRAKIPQVSQDNDPHL